MALNLPPDPYKALGVSKDATLPEIRSAHRKLVLKCHPDKVQDADLKAIKQEEFQNVQQAYELLSDDARRVQYDEQLKLYELRKEMGKGGNPNSRANPFDFEVRSAEPRPNTYSRSRPTPTQPNPYTQPPPPRSYEDVAYEEAFRTAKKSPSYESAERRRPSTRDGANPDRRKYEEEEMHRWEKENKRTAHVEKKKSRDKEKRRGAEEKYSRSQPYVEDDSDDYRQPREKKSTKHRAMEEEIKMRNEEAVRAANKGPLTPKWDKHKEDAAEYMQAARRKAVPTEEYHHGPMRRAETFTGPEQRYNIRYATPHSPQVPHFSPSDDDAPRRSSARPTRRASETPPTRREPLKKEHKRSPSNLARDGREPYIVEPPSPTPQAMKIPKLQTHTSAPPNISGFPKPNRSKTQEFSRQEASAPPLPRAKTFQSGDREHVRDRDRDRERGTRLKKSFNYDSDGSELESSPIYASPRHSHSPPQRTEQTKTRYSVENGRSIPISRHRSDLRNIDDDHHAYRERSTSPRSRPPMTQHTSSRQAPQRSHSQTHYPPDPPEPVILPARPKMAPERSGSGRGYFDDVKYTPNYAEQVVYSPPVTAPEGYRRGSDPSHHHVSTRDPYYVAQTYQARRGGRELYT